LERNEYSSFRVFISLRSNRRFTVIFLHGNPGRGFRESYVKIVFARILPTRSLSSIFQVSKALPCMKVKRHAGEYLRTDDDLTRWSESFPVWFVSTLSSLRPRWQKHKSTRSLLARNPEIYALQWHHQALDWLRIFFKVFRFQSTVWAVIVTKNRASNVKILLFNLFLHLILNVCTFS